MSSAFSPISDGPSATITAAHTHADADSRGADVVQAVEGVAHQHDAEAREHLDRDPRADQRGTTTSRTVTPPGRPRRTAGTRSPRRTRRRRARARGRRTAGGRALRDQQQRQHRVDARRLERDDALRRGQPHADDRQRHERRDEHRRRPQPAVHGSGSGLARAAGSSVGTSSWTSSTRRSASTPTTSVFGRERARAPG